MSSKKKPAAVGTSKAMTKTAPKKTAPAPAKGKDAGAKTPAPAAPAAAAAKPKQEALPEVEISLKELSVVLNDSTGKIKASGRWPIIVDENERALVFLRHRDCNNLNVLEKLEMDPEPIRRALIGAIRYGKPMTINLSESGSIDMVADFFNAVMPNLWDLLLTKQILENDEYMKLVRPNDDADFKHLFAVGEGFTFIFLTSNPALTDDTKRKVIVFRIV